MMSSGARVDRDRIRALVRAELENRIRPSPAIASGSKATAHAAFGEILLEGPSGPAGDADWATPRPCVIEPDRACYNSGYCKKLGH